MELIKTLDSVWIKPDGSHLSVEEALPLIKHQMMMLPSRYVPLAASMQNYGQRIPIRVTEDRKSLRDGIHRVAIADDMDWMTMTVWDKTATWHEWDESIAGQEYHNQLWRGYGSQRQRILRSR